MKIAILVPSNEFTPAQQKALCRLGQVVYTKDRNEYPLEDLMNLTKGAEILAVDPDVLGGFEKALPRLTKIMEGLPKLRGVALSSSVTEWVDLKYCRSRNLLVTNIPYYSTESVAEHVLGLLICLAKKIIINDRRVQAGKEGKFNAGLGFELKGKTLGIIGLGQIGSRVAELGQAVGMRVIAYNRTSKKQKGIEMKSLTEVLSKADAISINLATNKQTSQFVSSKEINKMKKGVIVVNLVGPVSPDLEIIDLRAMAKALRGGKVAAYAFEVEDLINHPLVGIETAIGLKGFAWYTKDALGRAMEIWTNNIISIAKGKPVNQIIII